MSKLQGQQNIKLFDGTCHFLFINSKAKFVRTPE